VQRNDGIKALEEILRQARRFNDIDVVPKAPEQAPETAPENQQETVEGEVSTLIETISNILPGPTPEEVEDAYDSLDESNENSNEVEDEDEEEEFVGTTLNPPLMNDKFLHQEFLSLKPKRQETERGFNFSNSFIKNLTDKFSKQPSYGADLPEPIKLEEKPLPDYDDDQDDAEIEGLKAPWSGFLVGGPTNQKELLKGGGLIIQRLRVRNGSIAVAGPGGVATAGSGGTAIVGPEGLAITHPRSLTIAGQGARVFEVPESEDLEKQLLSLDSSGTPRNGKLVAIGPTIYFNKN